MGDDHDGGGLLDPTEELDFGNHPETLAGVRVVDLTRLLPGPFGTMLLADLGADVIKVEAPGGGDYARWYPPHVGYGPEAVGAFFSAVNRGKRSLTLDLKKPSGREALLRLVAGADVLVDSFRPAVLDRLGLSDAVLREQRSDLVVCAITGYGQTGPYRDRAGHDLNYLALCGALDQNAPAEAAPHPAGFQLADVAGGGLYAAFAIVSALFHRERTGQGARLDISMTEGALTFMAPLLARLHAGLAPPARGADQLTGGLPCYRVYETRDGGFISLGALEPKFWGGFCQVVGKPEWMALGHSPDSPIHPEVEALFATRDRDEWAALLGEHDICAEPVLRPDEVVDSALLKAREAFFLLGRPGQPPSLQTATPATPLPGRQALRPPPLLGEHSLEVLTELGYDDDDVAAMFADGVTSSPG